MSGQFCTLAMFYRVWGLRVKVKDSKMIQWFAQQVLDPPSNMKDIIGQILNLIQRDLRKKGQKMQNWDHLPDVSFCSAGQFGSVLSNFVRILQICRRVGWLLGWWWWNRFELERWLEDLFGMTKENCSKLCSDDSGEYTPQIFPKHQSIIISPSFWYKVERGDVTPVTRRHTCESWAVFDQGAGGSGVTNEVDFLEFS